MFYLNAVSPLHFIRHHPSQKLIFRSISSSRTTSRDPSAKRPTKVCDPYEQNGLPLSMEECVRLQPSIHMDWKILDQNKKLWDMCSIRQDKNEEAKRHHPMYLVREFEHENFIQGSKFLSSMAAVAFVNNHYPLISLERRLLKHRWQIISKVECHTKVLKGLSYNDFQIAMYMDFETDRLRDLIIDVDDDTP